jgi:uncharacterized membrane protein YhaH (DUF805 family)
MGAYGLVWSGLKKLLVREGRAGRADFVLKGLLPLWLALFALLSGAAFPVLGELGLVLIIVALFFSRAGLAMAVRRAHDLGLSEDYLISFRRQSLAYFQSFIVLMFATTFLTVNVGNPATSLIIAAVAAAAMTCFLLGGSKYVSMLVTSPGEVLPNAHGLATPETVKALKALGDKPSAEALRKVMPREIAMAREAAHPLQSKVRGVQAQPVPESPARVRPIYKTKASETQPREPGFPQHPKPIVRKRKRSSAIGEWG